MLSASSMHSTFSHCAGFAAAGTHTHITVIMDTAQAVSIIHDLALLTKAN